MQLNLDKFIPTEKKVIKLAGKEYNVPGRINVGEMLQMIKLSQEAAQDASKMSDVVDILASLFAEANKDSLSMDKFKDLVTIEMVAPLLEFILKTQDQLAESKKNSGADQTDN